MRLLGVEMETKYLYRSAREQSWLLIAQIEQRIINEPHISHQLWQHGWTEWKDWRKIPALDSLAQQFPNTYFHYIGPSGRDHISSYEIIANIRLDPNKHHRIWKKGWKNWKHWYEEPEFANQLAGLLPDSKIKKSTKRYVRPKFKQTLTVGSGYNVLNTIAPTISFTNMWNLHTEEWMLLASEDRAQLLDELQNALPNLDWKEEWIDDVIAYFWTSILDCCFGSQNGNGELRFMLKQNDRFCLPKVCTFLPEDPRAKGGVFSIKTSSHLQPFFDNQAELPSFGDQSPFRNARIWSSIVYFQQTATALSRRRSLAWVIHQLCGYDIIHVTQIISVYERLFLQHLKDKHVFEMGDLGKLTLRKARSLYHIGFHPSEELVLLVNTTIEH